MSIFDANLLRQEHAGLLDRAKAISNLCTKEDREPTAEEQSEIDTILNTKIPAIKAKIDQAEKYRAELEEIQNNGSGDDEPPVDHGRVTNLNVGTVKEPKADQPLYNRITVPDNFLWTAREPRAFKGPKAREQAFIAGRFYLAALFNHSKSQQWCRDHGIEFRPQSALETGDNALGGVLVPTELERTIITLKEERGVAMREAQMMSMGSDVMQVPRWVSGPTAYYVKDGGSITASDIKWDNIELVAKKLAALVLVSSELNEDAIVSIGDQVTMHMAYAFADEEDEALFNGDGTSTYGGQVGLKNALAAGSKYTAITGNTSFGTLDLADFENMIGQLPTYAMANAKWYIHKTGWARSMQRLADAAGGNTVEHVAGGASRMMFLGLPVVFVQVMNSTTAAQTSTDGLAYCGDMAQTAMFGSRRGIGIAISTDFKFQNDQIAIRGIERYVVNVHERGDASNAGSMIMLSTPSS